MNAFLPMRIVFLLKLALLNLMILFCLRLGFYFMYSPSEVTGGAVIDIIRAFYLGGKFDLRLVALCIMPFFFLSKIGLDPVQKKQGKKFWANFYTFVMALILFSYAVDFGTYSYLETRVNTTLLKFLKNPLISLEMVWQSYPVVWIGLALVFFLIIYKYLLLNQVFVNRKSFEVGEKSWQKKAFLWLIAFILWVGAIYGKFAFYPLRWSEAFFTKNTFVSNLSLNPILFFVDTFKHSDKNYDVFLAKKYYPAISDYLGVTDKNKESLNFHRQINPHRVLKGSPNIVVIVMESMAAFKTGLFGNKLNPTPYLDSLGKESLFFNRFYVPSQATARSIFGAVTGIPDVSQSKSGSRNPFIVNQNSVINALDEHEKYYFLGGSANWGNIRGIFTHNVEGIKVFEEGDYSSPRMDVWGISDYHLFKEANNVFKKQEKPFFAFIQSSSFHRPYTIPKDRGEFKETSFKGKTEALKKFGFVSEAEYNSLKFQDYSLGNFFELAKKEKYYKNTVFFIFGDHGLPGSGGKNIPVGEQSIDLPSFHVPFLIHGPEFFDYGVDERFVSELDVFPTIVGLLGKKGSNSSLGRNIFDPQFDDKRSVFTFRWYAKPPKYGIVEKDFFYEEVLGRKGTLNHYTLEKGYDEDVSLKYPEKYEKMKNLARGFYQTSKFMLFNNKRKPGE